MTSEYRGEVRPRRQPARHHMGISAGSHRKREVLDPFPPLSNSQFPAMYIRSPVKNAYRSYMRSKSAYKKPKGF